MSTDLFFPATNNLTLPDISDNLSGGSGEGLFCEKWVYSKFITSKNIK